MRISYLMLAEASGRLPTTRLPASVKMTICSQPVSSLLATVTVSRQILTRVGMKLSRDVLSVSEVEGVCREALSALGLQRMEGEIVDVRPQDDGAAWVTVADDDGAGVDAYIAAWRAKKAGLALVEGEVIRLHGNVVQEQGKGSWHLQPTWVEQIDQAVSVLAERRRRDLADLVKEGVVPSQRATAFEFTFPGQQHGWPTVRRALVLTSGNSAGGEDFRATVQSAAGPTAHIQTRKVRVQGRRMVGNLIEELDRIEPEEFDIVFIMRGGGGWQDLRRFNDPDLARAIARCTSKVVTALGHYRDISLADRAAFDALATPSLAASAMTHTTAPRRLKSTYRPAPVDAVLQGSLEYAERERVRLSDQVRLVNREVNDLRAQLHRRERDYGALWNYTTDRMWVAAHARMNRRIRGLIVSWMLVALASISLLPAAGSWWPGAGSAAILALAITAYIGRGPRRVASSPPSPRWRRRHPAATHHEWVKRLERARTPRELQALRHHRPA